MKKNKKKRKKKKKKKRSFEIISLVIESEVREGDPIPRTEIIEDLINITNIEG
jgi:hypothetical protein